MKQSFKAIQIAVIMIPTAALRNRLRRCSASTSAREQTNSGSDPLDNLVLQDLTSYICLYTRLRELRLTRLTVLLAQQADSGWKLYCQPCRAAKAVAVALTDKRQLPEKRWLSHTMISRGALDV